MKKKFGRFKKGKHTSWIKEIKNPYPLVNPILLLGQKLALGCTKIEGDWLQSYQFGWDVEKFTLPYLAHFDWICRAYNIPFQFLKNFDQNMVNKRVEHWVYVWRNPNKSDDF